VTEKLRGKGLGARAAVVEPVSGGGLGEQLTALVLSFGKEAFTLAPAYVVSGPGGAGRRRRMRSGR